MCVCVGVMRSFRMRPRVLETISNSIRWVAAERGQKTVCPACAGCTQGSEIMVSFFFVANKIWLLDHKIGDGLRNRYCRESVVVGRLANSTCMTRGSIFCEAASRSWRISSSNYQRNPRSLCGGSGEFQCWPRLFGWKPSFIHFGCIDTRSWSLGKSREDLICYSSKIITKVLNSSLPFNE